MDVHEKWMSTAAVSTLKDKYHVRRTPTMDIVSSLVDVAPIAWLLLGIWFVAYLFIRYFDKCVTEASNRSESFDIDARTFKTIDRVLDTVAVILATALTLSVLGITGVLYATLTAFGVIGLIIGLAIKDLTSNVFSGIMMLFNPSFLSGDYIEIEDFAGTVEKISLRMTTLRRSDGVILTLPNTMFITKPIINYSITKKRRVEITVGIANETDVEIALSVLKEAAENHNNTLRSEGIDVVMTDVKDYAVDLTLRFWVPPSHLRSSTSEVLQQVTRSFKKKRIELAVPLRKYI
jgi:small conductance mechanosensitive channel